jgi:hypothetical protein
MITLKDVQAALYAPGLVTLTPLGFNQLKVEIAKRLHIDVSDSVFSDHKQAIRESYLEVYKKLREASKPAARPTSSADDCDSLQDPLTIESVSVDDDEYMTFESASNVHPFVPWGARKAGIISKYNTMVQLSVPSIQTDIQKTVASAAGTSDQAPVEQIRTDVYDLGELKCSQKEYMERMNIFNEDLKESWAQGQRVRALKMAIYCAIMLGDTSVPHFYPTAFVFATEILDTFGDLVFERIKSKGIYEEAKKKKPLEITPEDVLDESRETCRNWFYKIASIRKLLPRIYMEICILKAYQFLHGRTMYEKACVSLAKRMRGIGNPLVAAYARAYLARRGIEVLPKSKKYLSICFNDQVAAIGYLRKTMDKVLARIDPHVPAFPSHVFRCYLSLLTRSATDHKRGILGPLRTGVGLGLCCLWPQC